MQKDLRAGTVVVLPTANASKSVKDVTVIETPELVNVLAILSGSSFISFKGVIFCSQEIYLDTSSSIKL